MHVPFSSNFACEATTWQQALHGNGGAPGSWTSTLVLIDKEEPRTITHFPDFSGLLIVMPTSHGKIRAFAFWLHQHVSGIKSVSFGSSGHKLALLEDNSQSLLLNLVVLAVAALEKAPDHHRYLRFRYIYIPKPTTTP